MPSSSKIHTTYPHLSTQTNYVGRGRPSPSSDSDNEKADQEEEEEDLLAAIEDDAELSGLRERRMEELKAEMARNQAMRESSHGQLVEIKIEKDLIKLTANTKTAVVHFFHRDFRRCKIMDKHLEKIAARNFSTRFLRIDVANAPFLVTKLSIKVLPCVICFVDGITKDQIIGFEGITETDSDDFPTSALELRFQQSGVIKTESRSSISNQKPIFGTGIASSSSGTRGTGNDLDWDD